MATDTLAEKPQHSEAPLLLAPKDAYSFLGLSRATFFRQTKRAGFPKPIQLPGVSRPYYRRADLEAWVAELR